MDTTKVDFVIEASNSLPSEKDGFISVRMEIGGQVVWRCKHTIGFGESLTLGSVSVPTDELIKYMLANCTFK